MMFYHVVSNKFKSCAWKLLIAVKKKNKIKRRNNQSANSCQNFLRHYNAWGMMIA
jgi:hypothetical protein